VDSFCPLLWKLIESLGYIENTIRLRILLRLVGEEDRLLSSYILHRPEAPLHLKECMQALDLMTTMLLVRLFLYMSLRFLSLAADPEPILPPSIFFYSRNTRANMLRIRPNQAPSKSP
jgi:hypothetical protein